MPELSENQLRQDKLACLRRALILETDAAVKFKLEQEIAALEKGAAAARLPPHLPPRNREFVGREEELQRLHGILERQGAAALTQNAALHGLGGIGKTQLAMEYAHRHAAEYEVAWWLRAETEDGLLADFESLGRCAGLELAREREAAARQALAWLAARRWLLVYDNAEEPGWLRRWLPGGQGRLLITSRNPAWSKLAQTEAVGVLSADAAAELLGGGEGAAELARELGYLPLALAQAAAYCDATGLDTAAYLQLYRERQIELLQRGELGGEYPATVLTTWDLAFAAAEKTPGAADLLRVCACYAPDDILLALFGAANPQCKAIFPATLADPLLLRDALSALHKHSLVTWPPDGQSISLHRLVQTVTRSRLPAADEVLAQAARLLVGIVPGDVESTQNPACWLLCDQLLPHLQALRGLWRGGAAAEIGFLLNQLGLYLQTRADYAGAAELFRQAIEIGETYFGKEHTEVAVWMNNLGFALLVQGDITGAEIYRKRSLEILEFALGTEHPKVATGFINLGVILQQQGDSAEARRCFERALRIFNLYAETEHTNIATSIWCLGVLDQKDNDLNSAQARYEQALRIDEAILGGEHLNVARDVNSLGSLLQDLGDLAGALACYKRALRIDEVLFGTDHPNVAIRVNNLGTVLKEQGDLAGARACFERALGIFQTFLGEEHPYTKGVRGNLESLSEL